MATNRRRNVDGRIQRQHARAAMFGVTFFGFVLAAVALAQQPGGNRPGGGQANGAMGAFDNVGNGNAGLGGGANADFDSLIDLITSTISPDSWVEGGGGTADIRPFPSGVLIDAAGTLRLKSRPISKQANNELTQLRGSAPVTGAIIGNPRRASQLRYISLPRLEAEIARRQVAKKPLDLSMLTLAGLQRVKYIFVYPESGDLVLAGPAGDWRLAADSRIVSTATGQPVVRLDDLLVLFRRGLGDNGSFFGCSINPRQEALAKTQAYLNESSAQPLQPGQRGAWLAKLRDTMGKQDIEIFGVDPTSRVASVLVEADYHMKLVGMGLADGVPGVESYLDSIEVKNGEAPSAMSVLRWWFALNYETIRSSAERNAFELVGQAVRVLSENEMLAEQGRRVHTGQSDPLNKLFADRFTEHFAALAEKYPVYAELRNVFDLSMAAAVIESEGLAKSANWQPILFPNAEKLALPKQAVPRQVETVINHRVMHRRQVVAGVSGGVMVAAKDVLAAERATDATGALAKIRQPAPAKDPQTGAWWWDAE